MALWQMLTPEGVAHVDQFDDGLAYRPGEDGFSTTAVEANAANLGLGYTFSLIGVPGWHARIEAEQLAAEDASAIAEQEARASAAKDRIAQLLDPKAYAARAASVAISEKYNDLMEFASAPEKKALAKLLKAELAALAPTE